MRVGALLTVAIALLGGTTAFVTAPSIGQPTILQPPQGPASSPDGELKLRLAIADRVHQLVQKEDFKSLNALEREYRLSRERTPSGSWKLQEYYIALDRALPQPDERNDCFMPGGDYVDAWLKATPGEPAPVIIKAGMLAGRGWCFRGGAYASEVTDTQWALFHENIAAAHAVLTENKCIASVDPQYYPVLESIYRAEGREPAEFRKLLDEATAKEPYYYNIYWAAYEYYLPQWFGSPAAVDALARYAAGRTKLKDGLGAYARFYWVASESSCGCWSEAIDWPTMKQAMRDVAARNPDPWNFANFARLSCRMNDAQTARLYFEKLGKANGAVAWQDEPDGLAQCRRMAGL